MIGIINKLRIRKNREAVIQQINWIHEELNSACECNDIAELKKKLHVFDSRLYLLFPNMQPKESWQRWNKRKF